MPELSPLHHLFLQSCISHRTFSDATAQALYAKCQEACREEDAPSFADMLDDINPQLDRFGFQIKKMQDEYTSKLWWCFANTKSDELAKAATEYCAQEIAYFRTLIKLIMKSGKRYAINTQQARSAGKAQSVQPELKPTQATAVLTTLVARGWLIALSVKEGRERKEYYQLSSRAKMELETYLLEEYPEKCNNDIACKKCDTWVFKGAQCPNGKCKTRFHDQCLKIYVTRKGKGRNVIDCPVCKKSWNPDESIIIGPEAEEGDDSSEEEGDGSETDNGRAGPSGAAKKNKARAAQPAEESSDDDAVEEEPARRASKANGRKASSTRQQEVAEPRDKLPGEESEEEKPAEDSQEDQLDSDDDDPATMARKRAAKKRAAEKKRKRA